MFHTEYYLTSVFMPVFFMYTYIFLAHLNPSGRIFVLHVPGLSELEGLEFSSLTGKLSPETFDNVSEVASHFVPRSFRTYFDHFVPTFWSFRTQ